MRERIERLGEEERIEHHDRGDEDDGNFPPITQSMLSAINEALQPHKLNQIIVSRFSINITGKDLHSLSGENLVFDSPIDFYLQIIQERGRTTTFPAVLSICTSFFVLLNACSYSAARQFTDNVNPFSYNIVFIPVNIREHWTLCSIKPSEKTIEIFDSLRHDNTYTIN